MCGVIGIISKQPVVEDLYAALVALQHRGQDAAGITVFDGQSAHTVKDIGLVRDVFKKEDAAKLQGKLGLGHVRYPTAGSTLKSDAQPFTTQNPCLIAMCHNGNLANYSEVRKHVEQECKRTLSSCCDIEATLHVFAAELAKQGTYKPEDIFKAVENTMKKLNGSYSVVGFTERGLFAFRDPHGIRPLVLAKSEHGYAFSSETGPFDILGYKVVKDVEPGEAIFISEDLQVSSKKIAQASPAHCMFEWVYFARADSVIENKSVYDARLELGRALGRAFKKSGDTRSVDVVMPVPDTARPAASGFSDETKILHREGLLKNRYAYRTFIMPSQRVREREMRMKLNPLILEVRGKRIALIDDSLVRGTTSRRLVKILRDAGAEEVHLFFTCPPLKFACPYGIDMATRGELAATNKTIEQIRREVGADSLNYQSIEDLRKAIDCPLCTACLDGNYPTGLTTEQLAQAEAERDAERRQYE